MDKETKFMVYCIEEYKRRKSLTGKEVIALFHKYDVLDYIVSYYEALHTTGPEYIIDDLDLYMAARQS